MNHNVINEEDSPNDLVAGGFLKTLLPFFSWFVGAISSALFGCRIILVLRRPTKAYERRVMDSWAEGSLFSAQEIVSFQTASGRRRVRKKLKKMLSPLIREINVSGECGLLRRRMREESNRLSAATDGIPVEFPRHIVVEVDIAAVEKSRSEEIGRYKQGDISETFPIAHTIKPSLVNCLKSEVSDYENTVKDMLWEGAFNWDVIRQIRVTSDSSIWRILEIDPKDESLTPWIDVAFDLAFGRTDENKAVRRARWVIGRLLVNQFLENPYSKKTLTDLDRAQADDDELLIDEVPDPKWDMPFEQLEEKDIIDRTLSLLSPAQREDARLILQAENPRILGEKLGKKRHEAAQRNFERARRKVERMRELGTLNT